MVKNIFFIITYLTIGTINMFSQSRTNTDFLFPLDIPPVVSGSFAELRPNHFHSGVDLSTNGKVGIPIKSMEEGVVSRIKVSPVGYGNAIYIKHPNGYTTVYGHLRNYSPKVDSIITSEQYKIKSFSIDFFPKKEISIAKGEVIGYSGNTGGSGGPHLHYEIRDTQTEEPLNPFFFQNIIKDDIRPKLLTLRVYPINNNSYINEQKKARNYPIVFYDGSYHLKSNPKINACGNIGIGLEMLDYMTGSWKRCGIYSLVMFVNDKKHYSWVHNRFSFAESRYINSHIDYSYKTQFGKRFEKCFRSPGNKLSIYSNVINEGIINMDTSKKIKIEVSDAAGNISTLQFNLSKANISSNANNDIPEKLSYLQSHHLSIKDASCYIPKGALYEDVEVDFSKESNDNGISYIKIGSKNIPLHKRIKIRVKVPDSLKVHEEKLCLATINGSKKLIYAGGRIEGDSIIYSTKTFDNLTFATDSIPPQIRSFQNIKGKYFNINTKFTFKITDNFSGIKSYNGYLNGVWTLFEYDKKSDKLTCKLSKAPVKKGEKYNLKLIVTDNCGNHKTLESYFTVSNN